jgi:hypothetical protein
MSAAALKAVTPGSLSELNFHMGEAFLRVASDYPTVHEVILEQVQNAIDANAKHVLVVLNRKTRHIAIRDNGDGTSEKTFEEALQRVCLSGKESGKLGRFGIGLISPLGKCERFTFTSSGKGLANGYHEWEFVTDDIRRQSQRVTIPNRSREDLFHIKHSGHRAPKGLTTVMWRTEINIFGYSSDRMISRISSIENLRDSILERFGPSMRRNKVTLDLKFMDESGKPEELKGITAQEYTGRKLPEVTITNRDAGKVVFKLYLATKTTKGQSGKVQVGEIDNDYRFPFSSFTRSSVLLADEVIQGLQSGIFEGEILGEKVTLHSTRRSFNKNDSVIGFCEAIEEWFAKHGAKHLEEIKEQTRDKRYQDLGLESLRELEAMLLNPSFQYIRDVLGDFQLGSVGERHAFKAETVGVQSENSIPTNCPESPPPNVGNKKSGASHQTSKPEGVPYTSAGPRGKRRALVSGGNLGLQFSYIAMDGSDKLWELDIRQGILHFNVNHPIWVACDVSDRKVKQLQITVAINALLTEAIPADYQEWVRLAFDESLRPLVHMFHTSPAFNLRKKAAE